MSCSQTRFSGTGYNKQKQQRSAAEVLTEETKEANPDPVPPLGFEPDGSISDSALEEQNSSQPGETPLEPLPPGPAFSSIACKNLNADKLLVKPDGWSSCLSLYQAGNRTDGVYTLDSDGTGPQASFEAYCDMTRNAGGWTLVMRVAHQNFAGDAWDTVTDFQPGSFNDQQKSFKFSDSRINQLKTDRYRLNDYQDAARYFTGKCKYGHTTFNKCPVCAVSYNDLALTQIKIDSTGSWDEEAGLYYYIIGVFDGEGVGPRTPDFEDTMKWFRARDIEEFEDQVRGIVGAWDNRSQGIGDHEIWYSAGTNGHIQTNHVSCGGEPGAEMAGSSTGYAKCTNGDTHWMVQCGRNQVHECTVDTTKNNFTMWVR